MNVGMTMAGLSKPGVDRIRYRLLFISRGGNPEAQRRSDAWTKRRRRRSSSPWKASERHCVIPLPRVVIVRDLLLRR
jgi:hypothetical protein